MKSIAIAAALGLAALSLSSPPADAAGCLKGAILGGIAGHFAGEHGFLGAGAGCLAGRYLGNRSARQQQSHELNQTATTRSQTRTVVARDKNGNPIYKDAYGRLIARNQTATPYLVRDQNGNTVTRYRVETTGYGSSTPEGMR